MPQQDKIKYFNFLLENAINFSRDEAGNYVALVKVLNPAFYGRPDANVNQSNGNNSYKNYQKRNNCNCKCHCCNLLCCDELLEYKINEENGKLNIKKLIRNKDYLIDENRKLKKHILILTDQNQCLINELDIIVSSSEFSTIDINHNGINHLNKIINDNRYRLEKSLDELENSINQRKNEL